jgi:hypothetical protein
LVIAGIAVHEQDVCRFQTAIGELLERRLAPLGFDLRDFELHASELRNPEAKSHKYSPWRQVDYLVR